MTRQLTRMRTLRSTIATAHTTAQLLASVRRRKARRVVGIGALAAKTQILTRTRRKLVLTGGTAERTGIGRRRTTRPLLNTAQMLNVIAVGARPDRFASTNALQADHARVDFGAQRLRQLVCVCVIFTLFFEKKYIAHLLRLCSASSCCASLDGSDGIDDEEL